MDGLSDPSLPPGVQLHRYVTRSLHDPEDPAHRAYPNALLDAAAVDRGLRHEQVVDIHASLALLHIGHSRAQELLEVFRDHFRRPAENRERLADVSAADLVHDEARLLRR